MTVFFGPVLLEVIENVIHISRPFVEVLIGCCFQVDHKLVECFSHQIFHTGFVHADPHPGNSKFLTICAAIAEWSGEYYSRVESSASSNVDGVSC